MNRGCGTWSRSGGCGAGGLSAVDAALLASVVVTPGVSLWTRDKRLRQAARDVGVLAELD